MWNIHLFLPRCNVVQAMKAHWKATKPIIASRSFKSMLHILSVFVCMLSLLMAQEETKPWNYLELPQEVSSSVREEIWTNSVLLSFWKELNLSVLSPSSTCVFLSSCFSGHGTAESSRFPRSIALPLSEVLSRKVLDVLVAAPMQTRRAQGFAHYAQVAVVSCEWPWVFECDIILYVFCSEHEMIRNACILDVYGEKWTGTTQGKGIFITLQCANKECARQQNEFCTGLDSYWFLLEFCLNFEAFWSMKTNLAAS